MNQRQIDRAVATATGESVRVIRRHGFGIVRAPLDDVEDRFGDADAAEEEGVEAVREAVPSRGGQLGHRLPAA